VAGGGWRGAWRGPAYAVSWGDGDATSEVAVVDLRSGRVLSARRGLPPYLLLGEDRAAC
jgi:hypothetical protein